MSGINDSPYTIPSVPTTYNGVRFRSKLESRWARYFDALGIEWTYEPGTLDLGTGGYTPDFFLSRQALWVEVKGREDAVEWERMWTAVNCLPREQQLDPGADWAGGLLIVGQLPLRLQRIVKPNILAVRPNGSVTYPYFSVLQRYRGDHVMHRWLALKPDRLFTRLGNRFECVEFCCVDDPSCHWLYTQEHEVPFTIVDRYVVPSHGFSGILDVQRACEIARQS